MKAIVRNRYGRPDDVLALRDIDKPVVQDGEVLVRVHASAVAGAHWHLIRGLPYIVRLETGLLKPKRRIPGEGMAGQVEAIGKDVTLFQPGDDVFGWANGAFAEYVSVSEAMLVPKPANLSYEQAAAIPDSAPTALQSLRDAGQLQSGQKVLIIGASGGVGSFAVQIAKSLGAEVTGVCSTRNVDLVRSIGADHVIDYTQEDFAQTEQRYDLILFLSSRRSISDCRRALAPKGTLVLVGAPPGRWLGGLTGWLKALLLTRFVSQMLRPFLYKNAKADLETLKELVEAGRVTPVISAQFPLSEVTEAIRYGEEGHSRGKVVLTI